ncbi:hypothetical protein [Terasakiella pusilla]|uniref:hypothetical protein n=1 Tax=Terasakiella pusilla TaxID=64973 RepID=UPI003AA8285E
MSTSVFRYLLIFCCLLIVSYPVWFMDTKGKSKGYDLSTITDLAAGNSHSRSLIFSEMGLTGLNAYVGNASPETTFLTVFRYIHDLENLERIWVPLHPSFFYTNDLRSSLGVGMIGVLPDRWVVNLLDFEIPYKDNLKYWNFAKEWLKRQLLDGYYTGSERPENIITIEGAAHSCARVTPKDIQDLANRTVNENIEKSSLNDKKGIFFVRALLDLAERFNVDVIFYRPPYTSAYFNHPAFNLYKKQTELELQKMLQQWDNIYFIDGKNFFGEDDSQLFMDDDHLNCFGAKKFSPMIYKELLTLKAQAVD